MTTQLQEVQTVFTEGELAFIDLYHTAGLELLMGSELNAPFQFINIVPYRERLLNLREKYGMETSLSAAIKLQALVMNAEAP